MSVKQGAMALVLAGILSGCVAPAAKMAPAADADACPADNAMVQTTLWWVVLGVVGLVGGGGCWVAGVFGPGGYHALFWR